MNKNNKQGIHLTAGCKEKENERYDGFSSCCYKIELDSIFQKPNITERSYVDK